MPYELVLKMKNVYKIFSPGKQCYIFQLGHGLEVLRKILQFTTINGHLTLEMLLFLFEGRNYSVAVAIFICLPVWFPPRLLCSLSWEPFHWILL